MPKVKDSSWEGFSWDIKSNVERLAKSIAWYCLNFTIAVNIFSRLTLSQTTFDNLVIVVTVLRRMSLCEQLMYNLFYILIQRISWKIHWLEHWGLLKLSININVMKQMLLLIDTCVRCRVNPRLLVDREEAEVAWSYSNMTLLQECSRVRKRRVGST